MFSNDDARCPSGTCSGERVRYVVVVAVWNAAHWITSTLTSLLRQRHRTFLCVIIDDASDDGTFQQASTAAHGDPRFVVRRNEERRGAAYNFYRTLSAPGAAEALRLSDEDVVVFLDGDDWLAGDWVLDWLTTHIYGLERSGRQGTCWMSYGGLVYFPHGVRSPSPPFPARVVQDQSYREHEWISTHLRTCKYKLWRRLGAQAFKGPEGGWLDMTVDMATMFPLLEMAAGRACHVEEPLYVYNMANPRNDFRVNETRQLALAAYIRAAPRSRPLLWA